ncbi:TetR/AcrR family transcriptional regulator [Pengzhenrongella frigida]|uniref:TetR/AcrR family transcriptional regulator n=1 Tax=Pengzhenrongella frigida TaxID=1259133 RepID=A0A4Q5N7A2_9MICO|nr:TetR/AcrR family transcriptional regulator [Cellulomonas sp. HLT2-17]RYV52997.1 TetR/AcrR family transcriptional regulator [Cellulomonas sp. HLT2-17]
MAAETRRRGDTRSEIQRVALSRFTNDGYDKTSLREIAEDLGVTKAALYYHFRTKESILESLVNDVGQSITDLVGWVHSEPSTRERRLEMLRRLALLTQGGVGDLMRCVQQNELSLGALPGTVEIVHRYKDELWRACTPPGATLEDRLRARVAIMTILVANKGADDLGGTDSERTETALRIASDVMP